MNEIEETMRARGAAISSSVNLSIVAISEILHTGN
jgi:hypothetical protein